MSSDWIETVRWCHRADTSEFVETLIESFVDHCSRSRYSQPIHAVVKTAGGLRAEGYAILYPGALASLGSLSIESRDDDEQGRALLIDVVEELSQIAFVQGAEIIQAISPLIVSKRAGSNDPVFVSPDPERDDVLQSSGLLPIAKLVQMEAIGISTIPILEIPQSALELGPLDFVAYELVNEERWNQLIESTYVETLDVPELNGLRRIESTLDGYASTTVGVPNTWWVVQCKGIDIGCLLLTRTANACCELTYFGLTRQWRSKGFSKVIMNYVRDWALANRINGITLAVDLRNTPAIRLYQACGFMTVGFVQAWIRPNV